MKQSKILTLSLALWGAFSSLAPLSLAQQARPVRGGILFSISGMALIQHQSDTCSFLVVHDNKGGADQNRLARVDMTGNNSIQYSPLAWPTEVELPIDLEALTGVPQTQNTEFMAASSRGQIYHLRLNAPAQSSQYRSQRPQQRPQQRPKSIPSVFGRCLIYPTFLQTVTLRDLPYSR